MSFGSLRSRPVSPLISGRGDCLLTHKTIVLLVPFVPSMSRGITLGEDIARAALVEGHHLVSPPPGQTGERLELVQVAAPGREHRDSNNPALR